MAWFKRRTKNRRLEREQVLEVKLRASHLRAVRTRWVVWGLGCIFGTIFGVYLVWRCGEWALNRLVYENPSFAVREVDIATDGVIAVEQLRRWAGVKFEDNLLGLDLTRVKRDLELVPLIDSVAVERILPHTLRIRVSEREPIAQVGENFQNSTSNTQFPTTNVPERALNSDLRTPNSEHRTTNIERAGLAGGANLLLDVNGYVVVPVPAQQRGYLPNQGSEQLPAIVGIKANELRPGRQIETAEVQAALELLVAFSQSPMAGLVELKRIDVSSPGVLQVSTGQGSEVTFGLNDAEQQLRRWRQIFDVGQRLGRAVATLDLAVSNNIPARWLEASAVPGPPAKAAKPIRKQRKHV